MLELQMSAPRLTLFAFASLIVVACGSTTETGPQPAHVIVTPDAVTIPQKGTATLTVSVTDKDDQLLTGAAVSFSSSNTQMLTVSNLGVITSVGPAGTANVIAKSGKASTTVPVTITPVTTGITVTPDPVSLAQKTSIQLQAQVVDAVGTPVPGAAVIYTTSSTLITVSQTGLIQSLGAAGTATVVLSSGTVSRNLAVNVTAVATSFVVTPPTVRLGQHGQLQLSATLLDAVGSPIPNAPVTWSSSDQNVVVVSATGVIASVGPLGTATVTARTGNFSKTVSVEVATVVRPSGTSVTSATFGGAWGIDISSTGVILAPSSDGVHTARVDPTAGTIASTVSGTAGGIDVSFTSDGVTAYVANLNNYRIDIVDVATNTVTGTIATVQPIAVQVSRDNTTLYVGSGGLVVAYDLATKTEKTRIPVPGTVNAITLHPTQNLLYATGYDAGNVAEINTSTNSLTRSFHVSGTAQEAVVSPDGNTLYVAIEGSDLAIFDLGSATQQPSITGAGGFGAAMTKDGAQLWVVSGASVKMIDVVAKTYQTLALPGSGRRIVFSSDGSTAVITQDGSGIMFVR
jgi:DNA-binding beta-propeller fold protein YncE